MKIFFIDTTEKEPKLLDIHSQVIPRIGESITIKSKNYIVKNVNYWYEKGDLYIVKIWVTKQN